MRLALGLLILVVLVCLGLFLVREADGLAQWAVTWQRAFQNEMAAAVRAIQAGDAGAWSALLLGAGAYGFVHAVGPGHGKYLIGGAGLGSSVSARRLLGLSLASSLAQALWAIVLVYGGFSLLQVTAQSMTILAEDVLAPASYAAIATVGAVFVWRGARSLLQMRAARQHAASHTDASGCGCHGHGPTPDEAARLGSLRDAVLLIGSIAIRPCTGAIFLLVIAWQMGIEFAGAIAVIVMGLGTAGLTCLVAISSVTARGMAVFSSDSLGMLRIARPSLELLAGSVIVWISLQTLSRLIS
ncbi:MAG: hypothetical protein NXH97_09070 [Rhodobacteraceae bacterium]|nr:hypothetical protein [Paracoccaceae bacterium]